MAMRKDSTISEDKFFEIYGAVAYNGRRLITVLYEHDVLPSVFYRKYARMLHTDKVDPIGINSEIEEAVCLIGESRMYGIPLEEVCAKRGAVYADVMRIGKRYKLLSTPKHTRDESEDDSDDDGDLDFDRGKFTKCCTCKIEDSCTHKDERTGKCEAYVVDLAKRWREIDIKIYQRNRERIQNEGTRKGI